MCYTTDIYLIAYCVFRLQTVYNLYDRRQENTNSSSESINRRGCEETLGACRQWWWWRWWRKEERFIKNGVRLCMMRILYRVSDIFTVTEPGPLGAEIIHQGDVLAMWQTHTVWNCVYCETDIKAMLWWKGTGGVGRRNGMFLFFIPSIKENLSVFNTESSWTHTCAWNNRTKRHARQLCIQTKLLN